jgi:hypothetical protein
VKSQTCILFVISRYFSLFHKNIETNTVLTDNIYLKELVTHFSVLWDKWHLLQPTDLEKFKVVFDNFQKRNSQTVEEQNDFEKNILTDRKSHRQHAKNQNTASRIELTSYS